VSEVEPPADQIERASTTEALPVSPSLGPAMEATAVPSKPSLVDRRVVLISALSIVTAAGAAVAAELLLWLIGLITNVSFFGVASGELISPVGNHLGWWVIWIPVIGGVIVGLMARYGSQGIRGHGIPEAIEQVLRNESRVPARLMFLKPISAAIAIGTGGPFGAEGPIIATGGAMGSVLGQMLRTTAMERKTLLAAGAAAGMAATFGCPVAAVLLAVELLLFEFRPRSFIPVALASTTATAVRFALGATYPLFTMPAPHNPTGPEMLIYFAIGTIVGVASVGVTRSIYLTEKFFTRLPIHWMWWPALGALPVGIIGYFMPEVFGVGYSNISAALVGRWSVSFLALLALLKFVAWSISLGSGTSGGTLAPLFTIGSGLGALCGALAMRWFPHVGIDPSVAALVGMAAMFAGASRALLTSVVFAFETTLQPLGLLPLLGGCTGAFFVSCLLMPTTIMTEKISRRGVRVPMEYAADFLDSVLVGDVATKDVVTLAADWTLAKARKWMESGDPGSRHQGYPLVNSEGYLVGVLTRRDLLDPANAPTKKLEELVQRPPVIVYPDVSLRDAADHMVNHNIGRLPVIDRKSSRIVGLITRSDLLSAHRQRLRASSEAKRFIRWRRKARAADTVETGAGNGEG
jgi:H+/Cl- antiporter ClcA/CBS domain-containing protein